MVFGNGILAWYISFNLDSSRVVAALLLLLLLLLSLLLLLLMK